jgi:uncharacterized protein with GYD domain
MPKYHYAVSYTSEGLKGLIKEGGTSRLESVRKLLTEMGGSVEAFYYAFGEDDLYIIAEMPDNTASAAFALAVNAAAAATIKTSVLMTVEEIDQATQTCVNYLPPGS